MRLAVWVAAAFAAVLLSPFEVAAQDASAFASAYRLGSGDMLRVIVFGEDDLSGEFAVDDSGFVSFPLIGEVRAQGMTLRDFETEIAEELNDGYIIDPRVNVEIINYRPFYIYGEVTDGGEYPYVAGMNVLKAIAIAGGYTYRANQRRVHITRAGESERLTVQVGQDVLIYPGDVIEVPERFF